MAGTDFNLLVGVCLFLFSVWGSGRLFRRLTLPSILGEFLAGILLGPQFLDVVPFSSDGTCDTILFDAAAPSGSTSLSGRALGSSPPCQEDFRWTPRWASDTIHTSDIWSFAGTVGVTLLIMESGMHINFEKVRQIGGQALIVAIVGTAMPLVVGMLLVAALFPGQLYPDGFAAGCALAPTSVGISIKLLSDAKMLNSMAGQTTLTAAFVDDVFSLVLLVLLKRLSKGSANPLVIVGLMMGAFAFLAYGVVAAKRIYPHLEKLLSHIKFIKGASIQPRDEIHLFIMLGSLVLYAWIGSLIGSHLLGAFVAGMCFVNVPRSHQIWVNQLKRIIRWLIRIFFAATVGFAVPVKEMKEPEAIWKGLVLGLLPGILCKIISGIPARKKWDKHERARASAASIMTRGGIVQPIQYLVGIAMVARGEFAFLVAYSAQTMQREGAEGYMLTPKVYAALTWALVWALVLAPFLFKWALFVYMKASPIKRGMSIGGATATERNFVIQVVGQHHSGVLHEILNAIHGEGMDVLECRVETDGEVDTHYFVVQSRGRQKDFDDEKLQDIRHHIQEILGDEKAVVMFEAVADDEITFAAIELQVVTDTSHKDKHVVSIVTKRLQELGMDVEEIDEQHQIQIDHGHETEMERDLFYAVTSKSAEEGAEITRHRVHHIKRSLQSALRDEDVRAEVVVKPVADRSKGFSELQTFDPMKTAARAKGAVYELLCFGPHNVELLSTAVRKLEPLGLRLLHAAHSHEDGSTKVEKGQSVSRFFVEKMRLGDLDDVTDEKLTEMVLKVLMTTYKMDDETKFSVRPVDPESLQEMSQAKRDSRNTVPGLQDVDMDALTPDLTTTRRGVPIGLKEIPERAFDSRVAQLSWLDELVEPASPSGQGEKPGSPKRSGDQASRIQGLEAKVYLLEGLLPRVARLEALELAKRPSAGSSSPKLKVTSPKSKAAADGGSPGKFRLESTATTKKPQRGAAGVRFEEMQEVDAVRIKVA